MDEKMNEGYGTTNNNFDSIASKHFKSTIPPHLLTNLSEDERFIVEALSRLENGTNWITETVLGVQKSVTRLDYKISTLTKLMDEMRSTLHDYKNVEYKTNQLWTWKQVVSGKWAILWGILVLVIPSIVNFFLLKILK
jgi:hypothetical protein